MPQFEKQPKDLCLSIEKDNFISALKSENKKGFKDGFIAGYHKGIEETLEKLGDKINKK